MAKKKHGRVHTHVLDYPALYMKYTPCLHNPDPRLVGDPVDTLTGAVFDRKLEFRLTGPVELWWYRHYDSSQNHHRFAHGWGHAHDFERVLRFDADGLRYVAPLGRELGFPPLVTDGEKCSQHGFTLRRLDIRQYQLFKHGEPAMEFEFQHPLKPARLKRLFQGDHEILFRYGPASQLEQIRDSAGRIIRVEEDVTGRLIRLSLEHENKTPELLVAYEYDERGNLVATTNAVGHGYKFTYDDANRMIRRTGRKGFNFHFAYDTQGRCVRAVGDDRIYGVALEYEIPGRVTKVMRPDRGVWTYFFDEAGGLIQILDPLGGVQQFVRDKSDRVTAEVDPNGNPTKFLYSGTGAQIAKITPLGHRVALPEDPNAPGPLAHRVAANPAEYEYGRLLNIRRISLPIEGEARLLPLSADARWLLSTRPDRQQSSTLEKQFNVRPLGVLWWPEPESRRVFNDLGKLVQQQDEMGRLRHWGYDASGNIAQYTDFDGGKWIHDYGAWHFLIGLMNPLGAEVRFSYTTSGEVASFTDASGTLSEYGYDLKDHLVEVRRHGVIRDTYTRDAVGNLVAKHAADGRELLRFEIGLGNLPIKRTLASGDEHTFQYDKSGRYLLAATKKDSVEFSYDGMGNRCVEKRNGKGVVYRYGGRFAPSEAVFFDRFVVRYERQADGTLTITDPGGKCHEIRFLTHGLVERTFSNGSQETAQYDNLGRCLFKCARRGTRPIWSRRFHWSGEGELRRVEDSEIGEIRHEYDRAHRLSRRIIDTRIEEYEMDLADNLVRMPGLKEVTLRDGNRLKTANGFPFEYNDRNHIETRQTPNGEVRYGYDSRDQLIRVETSKGVWEAEYDALGRRTRKTQEGQAAEFYWNSDQLVAEINASGQLRLYIYADPLAMTPLMFLDYESVDADVESCKRYFVFNDQIGTPCLIEDERKTDVWRARIAPFGAVDVAADAKIQFDFRFPGHYFDADNGLHYNRFRYYDPKLGRYLQSDPWGLAGGFNLYAYRPNPLLDADVRGLGEESDPTCKPPGEDEESPPRRQSIAEREAEGGEIPQYARDNPDLYEFDTVSGRYRRIEGEGHSRSSEFPSGYREETHEAMIARYTEEGREQGTGRPVDDDGVPIPRDQLSWDSGEGTEPIDFYAEDGSTNLTYDHQTPAVQMWNDGATTTNPETGETTTYPPGRDTDRATRNDFYNDPNNLSPMSRSENSGKGGGGQTYNDTPPGDDYES